MQVARQGNELQLECPRCAATAAAAPAADFQNEDAPTRPRRPTDGQENLAAFLAGMLWFGVAGFVIGGMASGWQSMGLGIGVVAGVVGGLLIGSRIARIDGVLPAGLLCGFLPLIIILKDAFRRGRMPRNPGEFLVPALIIFGIGFFAGCLLVVTKKLILKVIAG
jgi:hypothetical protein